MYKNKFNIGDHVLFNNKDECVIIDLIVNAHNTTTYKIFHNNDEYFYHWTVEHRLTLNKEYYRNINLNKIIQ